ncbi:hypothetical protein [Halomonas halocynthiae]|uniref:hypothetical protein n=1 Tax=Halomonas halocynthiae TaxID=176290 RepID=UPI0004868ACB|nr:hypothetical protein [Halomonas halocynthiae]
MTKQHTPAARTDERTLYEAQGDAKYSVRYMILQERFYKRLAGLFKFTSLFAGSAAFAGFIASTPLITGISGLLITASTVLDFVIYPERKARQCIDARREYQALLNEAESLDLTSFDSRALQIAMREAPNIESLRVPAYNDSVKERGRTDYIQPLTWRERFMKSIA